MSGENEGWNKLSLEDIVKITNKIGLEFVESKKGADYYELMKPTVRARVALRLDDGSMSEAKLKRATETDPEYTSFLKELSEAKLQSEKLRIRYESYKNLFEARRSMLSYQKAELKLI